VVGVKNKKSKGIDGGNPDHENPFIGHSNSYDVLMENISKGTSWLCNENITVNTFETKYVCVCMFIRRVILPTLKITV